MANAILEFDPEEKKTAENDEDSAQVVDKVLVNLKTVFDDKASYGHLAAILLPKATFDAVAAKREASQAVKYVELTPEVCALRASKSALSLRPDRARRHVGS
jgi:hypothetical protein